MGTWGSGIFDNDSAADFAIELTAGEDLGFVDATLDRVFEYEYLEAPEAEAGLAAADVVALLNGHPGDLDGYGEALVEWATRRPAPPAELAAKAAAAVARVLGGESELLQLWEESSELAEWRAKVDGLAARLKAPPAARR